MKNLQKKNDFYSKVKPRSSTVLLVTFLLSALVGTQLGWKVSAAIPYTQHEGTLDGADWALRIPNPWNGMLVIVCRGYSPTTIPSPVSIIASIATPLEAGFAVAASNYGAVGFCIQAGVDSTYELTNYIIDNYDVDGKVFLYGLSMGGAVALLLGEKYPNVYSGVLDAFGTKDLKEQYETKSRWANLTDEELAAELNALGISVPPPGFSLPSLRAWCARDVPDYILETGGSPETHSQAYEDRSPTHHANIIIPVITVHGTDDPIVPLYESIMYQAAVAKAYKSNLYRLYTVPGGGHATGDVTSELPAHFNELIEWSNELTGAHAWPMFRHDLQRSGYSTSNAPNTNQTLWTYTAGGFVWSSPSVADGKVYVGADDNKLHCFDAATGTGIWNYTTGNGLTSAPSVADGKVYVGSTDDKVYCFDASTGAVIWSYTTGGNVVSSPAVVNGKVYVGSHDGKLYCFRADYGQVEWKFTTNGEVWSSPVVDDGKVYVGSRDRNVYCLDAATGALIWSYRTGDEVYGSPAVAEGRVYVCSNDRNVYCFDASTGAQIWNFITGDAANNPTVANGKVYVSSSDDNVYCLDALTGAEIWSYTTGGDVTGSVAIADGKVYFSSNDRNVYCLDAATGALIWSYRTGSTMNFGSAAVANGVVYIGSGDRNVYAFSPWEPIPEAITIGVLLLLSTIAVLVSVRYFRKRPKSENW